MEKIFSVIFYRHLKAANLKKPKLLCSVMLWHKDDRPYASPIMPSEMKRDTDFILNTFVGCLIYIFMSSNFILGNQPRALIGGIGFRII